MYRSPLSDTSVCNWGPKITDVVLLSQLLRERCRHYNSADRRGGTKVCLSGLSPGRGDA